jgi:ATPase subunit of ABC transporter with duplicated ATPase domains
VDTPATMLVVSHDRRFLDTVCERLWVVDDGRVAPFDGGYRAWRAAIADGWTVAGAIEQEARRLQPGSAARSAARASTHLADTEAARRGAGAQSTNGSNAGAAAAVLTASTSTRPKPAKLSKDAYRRQREVIDAELTRLNLRKNHLELELSKPMVQANFIELRRVSSELADVEGALAAAEDAWLHLEDRAP